MNITINNKEYELSFGFDFLDYLNENYSIKMEAGGHTMSSGLGGARMLASALETEAPTAVYRTIKAATAHLSQKPSNKDVEDYLNELYSDDEKPKKLIKDIKKELKKQPAVQKEMGLS